MCGDPYSTRPTVDSGDLIAIIHPSLAHASAFFGGRLHLSNRRPGATVSTLSCREDSNSSGMELESDAEGTIALELLNVQIHKFGQPLSYQAEGAINPVLHSFPLSACDTSSGGARLNLGVGGDGIVGRTVSIVDARRRVLGEGVIGWS